MSQISSVKPESSCGEPEGTPHNDATVFSYSGGGRLRKHADYQRAYLAAGKKRFSQSMTWFLARRDGSSGAPDAPARVGLTAGKVLGKAHERNRIKRRMREVVRHHYTQLPAGYDLILHPRRQVMTLEFEKLNDEILRIFRQAAALAAGQAKPLPQKGSCGNDENGAQ